MNYSYDPYDIWATDLLGKIKLERTKGSILSKIILPIAGAFEILSPVLFRKLLGVTPHCFPHVEAMLLTTTLPHEELINLLYDTKIFINQGCGWGLPFDWYSKNGVYAAHTPYITNTPYVIEALLTMAKYSPRKADCMAMFHSTWGFLESLNVMFTDDRNLALSYAPVSEPRIVINANSYAAHSYVLHACNGKPEIKEIARDKAIKITHWILEQQNPNGSWLYYADNKHGNFIDCFHSCFILKNLLKICHFLPEVFPIAEHHINKGWSYVNNNLYDDDARLCRRFVVKAQLDPFRWDLYDQAEYLGLLVDFELFEEANQFADHVEQKFRKGDNWYCRIDILGRRWGKNFLRWGIVPFWHHKTRLEQAMSGN
jgi:hypothetical protein